MSDVRIIRRPNGRQFAYVGDYTVAALDDFGGFWAVTRDIDGDEVRIATGLTFAEAVTLAKGAGA
jgi:hypothetical protein